jgi:hypothetical protein
MQELANLVSSESFKTQQNAYFEKYCNEFTDEDENKLAYTQIHNEYENFVEKMLMESLGEDKLKKIQLGMPDFIKR